MYDVNEKTLIALFLEYAEKYAPLIVQQYLKIPKAVLPILFPVLEDKKIKNKITLSYYSRILNIDAPIIISYG